MKLTPNYPTLTYEVDGGFLISVIWDATRYLWDSWIRHDDYGIAIHMFSVSSEKYTLEEYIDMLENRVAATREDYAIRYMGV